MADFQTGGVLVNTAAAGGATVTATLDTPPAGMCNKILWVCIYAVTATAADVQITKNDGTAIARIGGSGIGILNGPLYFGDAEQPRGGICGVAADASKVILTTTGGAGVRVSVGSQMVPA